MIALGPILLSDFEMSYISDCPGIREASDKVTDSGSGEQTILDPADSGDGEQTILDPADSGYGEQTILDPADSGSEKQTILDPADSGSGEQTILDPADSSYGEQTILNPADGRYGEQTILDPADCGYGEQTILDPADSGYGEQTILDPADSGYGEQTILDPADSGYGEQTILDPADSGYGEQTILDPADSGYGEQTYLDPARTLPEMIPSPEMLAAGRAVYAEINLDTIAENLRILKGRCLNKEIECMPVVKGNAFGHGAVEVTRFLKAHHPHLIGRVAVATVREAIELRQARISGPIHVLGNIQSWEMSTCVHYDLTPTVCSKEAIQGMAEALQRSKGDCSWNNCGVQGSGRVAIKVDTGMTRNGCQINEVHSLVKICKELTVPLDGIFSHFAAADSPEDAKIQTEVFESCIKHYRGCGYVFHMSGSLAIGNQYGTQYDYIRPGRAVYGLTELAMKEKIQYEDLGIKPAMCIKGKPTLVKSCPPGRKVGYGFTYECKTEEIIATFPIGYGDGYKRTLTSFNPYIIRDKTGERCPVVGRISMDAITVRLPCPPDLDETFTIIPADYSAFSVFGIARLLQTITNEVATDLSTRLSRVYKTRLHGKMSSLSVQEEVDSGFSDEQGDLI